MAILGVGSELRGDDAAGVVVARRVSAAVRSPKVLVVDCGPAPENYTWRVRRFSPSHVVLVDAVEAGMPPGSVGLYGEEDVEEAPFTSTHRPSLKLLSRYLRLSMGVKVALLGIQPASLELTDSLKLTAEVEAGVELAVRAIIEALAEAGLLHA